MKNILLILFVMSFSTLLKGQECPTINVNSKTDLDNWVAANAGTCNVIDRLNLIYDLDYSALSFIDTIRNFRISADISSMNGFQNVKHIDQLYSYGADLSDINVLDLKSAGTIFINYATIPDLIFMDDVVTLSGLYLSNVTFTNPSGLSVPNLLNVRTLGLGDNSGLGDLSIFSGLERATNITLSATSLNNIQPLQTIDTITSLILNYNSQLTNVNLQGFDKLEFLELNGGVVSSVTNLIIDTLRKLTITETQLTDLSFLSSVGELQRLSLASTEINTLSPLLNIPITESLNIRNNDNLLDLAGLENVTSLNRLSIISNANLTSIDQLINLQTVSEQISITDNPNLQECCVLILISHLSSSNESFELNLSLNAPTCRRLGTIISECNDLDGDGFLFYDDNCPYDYNPQQDDTDGDGVGDLCDACPTPITVQLTTQAEVDAFESTLSEDCLIQNLYIEGDENIFDLRPLSFLTSIKGTLGIIDSETIQSLDGLENITEIGGSLTIFSNDALTNIDGLSNLKKVGAIDITETDLLESIDALSSLDSIFGDLIVVANTSLSYCCSMEPFVSGEKYLQGTFSIGPNVTGCNTTAEITNNCDDSDGDNIINVLDNCPSLFNNRQDDFDKDGIGDVCDNCPKTYNPKQVNQDNDNFGDACDLCPTTSSGNNQDTNNNGVGDVCETLAGPESGFVGVGTQNPEAKMEIKDGDVFVDNIYRGVILKSADGGCFRLRVQNDGSIISIKIACP